MGLAASQGRLLTITRRLSDLELNTQSISNDKMRLSCQSEDVTKAYSDALNCKQIQLQVGTNNGAPVYQDLNYSTLTGKDSPLSAQYGLSDSRGRLLVTQDQATKFKASPTLNAFLTAYGITPSAPSTKTVINSCPAGKTAADYPTDLANVTTAQATYDADVIDTAAKQTALDAIGNACVTNYGKSTTTNQYLGMSSTTFTNMSNNWAGSSIKSISTQSQLLYCLLKSPNHDKFDTDMKDLSNNLTASLTDVQTKLKDTTLDATKKAKLQQEQTQITTLQALISGRSNCMDEMYDTLKDLGCVDGAGGDANIRRKVANFTTTYADQLTTALTTMTSITQGMTTLLGMEPTAVTTPFDPTNPTFTAGSTPDQQKAYNDALAALQAAQGKQSADLTALNGYKAILSGYSVTTTTTSTTTAPTADEIYYTNIYNRMQQGYVALSDEKNTINSKDWLTNQLQNGNLILEKYDPSKAAWGKVSWETDTNFYESYDDSKTTIIKAKYDSDMAKINTKDKKYDLELKNIDSEHNALQTELDSVKKVIDKNVERSYKSFNS